MISDIVFKYLNDEKVKTTSGGWGSTGSILDKEGYKSFGNSGGSGSGFSKDEDVTYTMEWKERKHYIEKLDIKQKNH